MGKITMGLVLAAMIGSIDIAPAIAKGGGGGGGAGGHEKMGHDNGRSEHRGPGYEHGRGGVGKRDYRNDGYRGRAYRSRSVVYAPPRPPGVSVFFPPVIIHP